MNLVQKATVACVALLLLSVLISFAVCSQLMPMADFGEVEVRPSPTPTPTPSPSPLPANILITYATFGSNVGTITANHKSVIFNDLSMVHGENVTVTIEVSNDGETSATLTPVINTSQDVLYFTDQEPVLPQTIQPHTARNFTWTVVAVGTGICSPTITFT